MTLIRPGALGDTILALPAIDALRAAFPNASLTLVGSSAAAQLREMAPSLTRVLPWDSPRLLPLLMADPDAALTTEARELASAEVTLAVMRDASLLEGSWRRLGGGRLARIPPEPPDGSREHVSEHLCHACLAALGVRVSAIPPPRLVAPEWAETEAARWLADRAGPDAPRPVAVHPGSGSQGKCWPAERFAALVRQVRAELGRPVVLIAGPADGPQSAAVRRLLEFEPLLAQELPLPVLAAVLMRCEVLVGNDSGVSHLAAALGVRTVALFGPTSPDRWAPRGRAVTVLCGDAPCAPCTSEGRRLCRRRACLESLDLIRVFQTAAGGLAPRSPETKRPGPQKSR